MAYNRNNYAKRVHYIREVYSKAKERDIPDTRILKHIFPSHGIHISYRQWMNIKGLKPSDLEVQHHLF